eukprot:6657220-Prymnesium_polylepis.1
MLFQARRVCRAAGGRAACGVWCVACGVRRAPCAVRRAPCAVRHVPCAVWRTYHALRMFCRVPS